MRLAVSTAALTRRAALGAGAILLAGCGARDGRAFTSTDTHPWDYPTVQAVVEMARLLRERSGGRLDIKIYAGGQLGSERDTLEITTFGGLDLNRVNLAPLNAIEPMTVIPSLPFLFKSTQHMRRSLDGPVGEAILESLTPHHLVGLCFYDSGERNFYNTKRPLRTPSDLHGLKLRVQNSDLYVAMVKALDADPTPMALGEVYQGLVQGVIDGAENNPPSYESERHFEAARYFSLTRHVMAPEILVMSASRWNKLPPEDQALVRQAARDSVPYMRMLWDTRVTDSMARLRQSDVEINEVDDVSEFSSLMTPVWDRFLRNDRMRELVAEIQALGEDRS